MLRAMILTPQDIFFDLGCGTGKIPIQAALQVGCDSVGKLLEIFEHAKEKTRTQ